MDKNCPMSQLRKETNSPSDEGLPSPKQQTDDRRKSLECEIMDPSPKESASVTTENDPEIQKSDSEKSALGKSEKSSLEISTATSQIGIIKEDHQCDIKTPVSRKSPEKKVKDPSQQNTLSTNAGSTSETQDNAAVQFVVSKTENVSPEDAVAKALELEYMNKYASEFSKELVFAVDVMTLVRFLNKLECRYIVYAASGTAPTSPCDDTLDQALGKMWKLINNNSCEEFEVEMKNKRINYRLFQKLMIKMAEMEEEEEYEEESFLTYCLLLAQSAVSAEINGVTNAREFIPLVICRTIQNFKDAGKLPSNFWERIAEKAVDVINRKGRK